MDGFPGGREILRVEGRAHVVHHRHLGGLFQDAPDVLGGVAVAGVDDRQLERVAEPRPGRRRHQGLRHLHHVLLGAAVDAAGEQHDVRSQVPQPLDALMVLAAVVRGDGVHHDGPGAEGRPFRGLRAHVAHHPGHGHLQPAAGGTGGEIEVDALGAVVAGFEKRRLAARRRVGAPGAGGRSLPPPRRRRSAPPPSRRPPAAPRWWGPPRGGSGASAPGSSGTATPWWSWSRSR